MFVNRLIQCIVLPSLLGAIDAEARAEPMLLLEIHQVGSNSNISFIGQPLYMAFVARADAGMDPVRFEGTYDADDVGVTFSATPEMVESIEFALTQPTGRFSLDISSFAPSAHPVDALWLSAVSDLSIQQFVPRLGHGLLGYDLKTITQTIDRIEYQMSGRNIVSFQEQTIRFYGQPVPEPTTTLLLLCCHAFVLAIWR